MKFFSKEKIVKKNETIKRYRILGIQFLKKDFTRDKKNWKVLGLNFSRINKIPVTDVDNMFEMKYTKHLQKMYTSKEAFKPLDTTGITFDIKTKLIAFYLPQFHTFKENEEWHGKGFTEWTNVTNAVPHFVGHRQPQLPIDVGFYDLSTTKVMKRQIELARLYGIYGFCFHYYWFSGKRLMEKPIFNWLNDKSLNFPFCLCWANENWSKLWDGGDKEILLEQKLLPEDDEKFANDILPFFKDERYIRIDNKPVFIVYRSDLFGKERHNEFIKNVKNVCKKNGIDDLYILLTNSFGFNKNPKEWNSEGIVEFPPHTVYFDELKKPLIKGSKVIINDFATFAKYKKYMTENKYKTFKGVFPGWDNTPRKAYSGANVYYGCTPSVYRTWLEDCINYTKANHTDKEQFVFINAWNEWAEGAHLEPDNYYGYAYLDATKKALRSTVTAENKKIIYVGHDAYYNGAQILSLNIIKELTEKMNYDVEMLLLDDGGDLLDEYKKIVNVTVLKDLSKEKIENKVENLYKRGFYSAICNTSVVGGIVEKLKKHNISCISLIHELPELIKSYNLEESIAKIAKYADKIVFASKFVEEPFVSMTNADRNKLIIRPQGLYKQNSYKNKTEEARKELRYKLGLNQNDKIVLLVGYADKRKGIDLFIDTAKKLIEKHSDYYFVIVGHISNCVKKELEADLNDERYAKQIICAGRQTDTSLYYAGADIYMLTSREDPFPSVVMEAFDVGLPVIGFKNAGGFCDIVTDKTGKLVEFENTAAMAEAVENTLSDKKLLAKIKANAQSLINTKFSWADYVQDLAKYAKNTLKKISVIVPNYNYGNYLQDRLLSIINQTYPIYELIVLDDCSTDNSLEIIQKIKEKFYPEMKIIVNEKNSGNVFNQWAKGIEAATGDYIWIAEADDLCGRTFLEKNIKNFEKDKDVVFSYTQSVCMDENGSIKDSKYYRKYTNDISKTKWASDYIEDGKKEIAEALCIKNTIPNVSAVLFKQFDIKPYMEKLKTFKVGGDLYLYMQLLMNGKIGFVAEAINRHRRHTGSVTLSEENNKKHYSEIVELQELAKKLVPISQEKIKAIDAYRKQLEYLKTGYSNPQEK